jgi:tripartite ATP-independent transporter DctM subunit
MSKHGYRPDLSAGTVAAAGTLGIMIPPSIPFVMYGIITENSIAKLLIAGIFPGLMLSALMCVYILIVVRLKPKLIRSQEDTTGHIPFEEKAATVAVKAPRVGTAIKELKLIFPAMLLIVLVLGSLYTGLATPTESAGVGAIGAFLVIVLLRRFSKSFFTDVLSASAKTSTMILFLVICGMSLSYVVSYLGLAQGIADRIINLHINKYIVIFILYALWYVMGCMMDPGSMIILTIPFIYPTIIGLGFDPIWLGVVSTLCVEIGMITPPVGFNLFIIKSVSDVPMQGIIKGVIPFVVLLTLGLIILTFFPQICLYLPSRM